MIARIFGHRGRKMADHAHVLTKVSIAEPTTVFNVKQSTNVLPWMRQDNEWDHTLLTIDHFDAVFCKTFAARSGILPGNGEGDGACLNFLE